MRRLPIVTQFALRSLVFVAMMAGVLGGAITIAVRGLFLEEATRTARVTANALILDRLEGVDLRSGELPDELVASLDRMTEEHLLGAGITTVKLWNVDGVLVYSSDGAGVGKSYADHASFEKALSGSPVVEVVRSHREENRPQFERYGRLIEVYAPLVDDGVTVGVFEIYDRYGPVARSMNRFLALMWVIIVAGSIPAYFLQLKLVKKTADELLATKGSLIKVNERLRESLDDMELHSLGTMQALVAAVDAKDHYTARHSIAVTDLAVAVGKRLGLGKEDLADLERSGLLHDVGKIGTPESILLKPDHLTEEEHVLMSEHAAMSGHIVESVPSLARIQAVVRAHHERWDGRGYPDGLAGERIPLLARILSVADAYDTMISERPYHSPLSRDMAKAELLRCSGSQFDPAAVTALITTIEDGDVEPQR